MSEMQKKSIATRDSYGAALLELVKEHPDAVVLDADLAAATKTGVVKKEMPERHFDCGIAEGNMIAVAAGMAAMGLTSFASSFAMFAAGRAFEQIRNSIGYHITQKAVCGSPASGLFAWIARKEAKIFQQIFCQKLV